VKALLFLVGLCVAFGVGVAVGAVLSKQSPCVVATYEDAVLYAGATDYVFALGEGTRITIRAEHGVAQISGSDALMGLATDGPAEPTPARLGRYHSICFDADGLSIKPVTK
jgi:hypothetical protein